MTIYTTPEPSEEALEAEEWLRTAIHTGTPARPVASAAPSDFTARVMARIETPMPQPVALAPRRQPLAPALRPLGIAGGAVGLSALLVLASLVAATLLAPGALILVLNALVGGLVAVLLLLTPLLDAAAALASNDALMLGLSALIAGVVLVWSRVQTFQTPNTHIATEA